MKKISPKTKVCHLTTVHPRFDNRIFKKECVSLANAGYEVVLIVGDGKGNALESDVHIFDAGLHTKAFKRLFIAPFIFAFKAWKINAAIYHFHDPELIISGLILRLLGRKVIYDIHEDYSSSINHRSYIPAPFKKITRFLWLLFENLMTSVFYQIIAEKYYQRRFPKAMQILNYPVIQTQLSSYNHGVGNTLLYTGNINEERGAIIHSDILNYKESIDLLMIGYCTRITWEKIKFNAANKIDKLNIIGVDSYVSYSEIKQNYEEGSFLCGLAIFPDSPHFREKKLTKFFEYMQYGIPIICSNFPVWNNLVKKYNCGISVNPNSKDEILKAITYLQENPLKSKEMGLNGSNAVKEQFNWALEAEKMKNLYRLILVQ